MKMAWVAGGTLLFLVGVWSAPVQFKPLDPDVTNPADYWLPVSNQVPEEYVNMPRFPVVPTPGPMATDILYELFPNGTAAPTNTWLKNLWGFEWDDFQNWNALYPYPYIVSPKDGNINFMYSGAPVNRTDNGRMLFGTYDVPGGVTPPIVNGTYPWMVMSAAFDFGLLVRNGQPRLKEVNHVHAVVEYHNGNTTVATLYLVKGSPYINIECNGALLGFGSKLPGVPPIIGLNGGTPGTPITNTEFQFKMAMGPTHPQGEYWHAYFDTKVSIAYPSPPTSPANLTGPYTGLLQIACGEIGDAMGPWLSKNRGVYATGADVTYDVDGDTASINFNWRKKSSPGRQNELTMLALPHHMDLVSSLPHQATKYWVVKGNMTAVTGTQWSMTYPLTKVGFGETLGVDASMKAELLKAVEFDFHLHNGKCPGDNVTGQNIPGHKNMELYAYVRDLSKVTEVAIVAEALGKREWAINLTTTVLACMVPVLKRPVIPPQPCPPPVNNSAVCVRDEMDLFYDIKWGGVISGWYSRFAAHYCQCDKGSPTACEGLNYCDNPEGWGAFINYGNAFYNDHHFQYGYIVKSLAWAVYFQVHKGADLGLTTEEIDTLGKKALAFARDYANPDEHADKYFTTLRQKDLFDGHSWAEGYSYSGRIQTWVNQQSGGEAINSYYALYLLGIALNDTNVRDWGRIHLASEMQSLRHYQHISADTPEQAQQPYSLVNKLKKCVSILIGNAMSCATFYGPNELFECSITFLPVSPVTREFIPSTWAKEAFEDLQERVRLSGVCVYPNPLNMTKNPCPGDFPATWWGNEWGCCPTDQGYPWNQWRVYPDWYPYMYVLQSLFDPTGAYNNLLVKDAYTPNPPQMPFPYMNSFGHVVGYQHDISRTAAFFTVATHN